MNADSPAMFAIPNSHIFAVTAVREPSRIHFELTHICGLCEWMCLIYR